MGNFNQILIKIAFLSGLVVTVLPLENASAQSDDHSGFLYQAKVLRTNATVHSGPGNVHYATEQLALGDQVTVYREDPGGWCAIRPVEGSFSLVPASTLEMVKDGVGRITQDGTQAWVGTKLGPVEKPLWQVPLKKDEHVKVLGQVSWPNPEGVSSLWYQIAPPAGEFRWIRISDIQLPASRGQVNSVQPRRTETVMANNPSQNNPSQNNPSQNIRSLNDVVSAVAALDATPSSESPQLSRVMDSMVQPATLQVNAKPEEKVEVNINSGWKHRTKPLDTSRLQGDSRNLNSAGPGSGWSKSPDSRSIANSLEPGSFLADETIRIAEERPVSPSFPPTGQSLPQTGFLGPYSGNSAAVAPASTIPTMTALERQLTRELVKPHPTQWRLEDLETAAGAIYRLSPIQAERQQAQRYLAKISDCKAIQAGYQTGNAGGPRYASLQSNPPIGTGVNRVANNPTLELDTVYDAHGWLTELVREGGSRQPTYALQNAEGKITHHLTPSPGMNLRRYLKSRIGVMGLRGYHNQLKLDHITADRIIELEKPQATFVR